MEKYGRAGPHADDNTAHAHCILNTNDYVHTYAFTVWTGGVVFFLYFKVRHRFVFRITTETKTDNATLYAVFSSTNKVVLSVSIRVQYVVLLLQ